MPLAARWRLLTDLPESRGREAMPGVYEIADAEKRVIYIGQSGRDVPNRLRQHLARNECIRAGACYWRYSYSRVPQAEEARLLSHYRSVQGELPACNRGTPLERDARRRYAERSGGE
ncbi:MAG: GIY-YIG nuclease family protein [Trueperaceae bacterium]